MYLHQDTEEILENISVCDIILFYEKKTLKIFQRKYEIDIQTLSRTFNNFFI